MLESKPINKIIWFDIETVPEEDSFYKLTPRKQKLFKARFKKEVELLQEGKDFEGAIVGNERRFLEEAGQVQEDTEEMKALMEVLYNNKASLFAEFGKVVCISIGTISAEIPANLADLPPTQDLNFKVKSFAGEDEVKVLQSFYAATKSVLDKTVNPTHHLCGHNILNFDVPFLAKRFIINGLKVPPMLDMEGKKEWNLPYLICTKNAWRLNVYDGNISLDLLCEIFNVKSSKDGDISGKDVRDVYYKEKDVNKIALYCQEDVRAVSEVYLRMKSLKNNLVIV